MLTIPAEDVKEECWTTLILLAGVQLVITVTVPFGFSVDVLMWVIFSVHSFKPDKGRV